MNITIPLKAAEAEQIQIEAQVKDLYVSNGVRGINDYFTKRVSGGLQVNSETIKQLTYIHLLCEWYNQLSQLKRLLYTWRNPLSTISMWAPDMPSLWSRVELYVPFYHIVAFCQGEYQIYDGELRKRWAELHKTSYDITMKRKKWEQRKKWFLGKLDNWSDPKSVAVLLAALGGTYFIGQAILTVVVNIFPHVPTC